MADDEERLTPHEHAILKAWDKAGLGDPKRIEILASLIEGAQAWGFVRRFLLQFALAVGAIGALAGFVFAIRDWLQK